MYYVYLLVDETGKTYVGCTNDLKRRFNEHNAGYVSSTRGRVWHLVYYEAYASDKDARLREGKLKQDGRAKRWLLERVSSSLKSFEV